ncbi:MAG: GNAT family N-acetyltransferase [Oscillospiraceae bacterium]|nr:GNAT family N-acetyltransferase [Oscillospiraceae bacterium]
MIKGDRISLVPAKLEERKKVYEWCWRSETTKSHAGPPNYPDIQIQTFEEFCEDYVDYFFTGSEPNKGRGFFIEYNNEYVGFISYCSYHLKPGISELDIWMSCEANCGKGFGTDAIISLGNYLSKKLNIQKLIMAPSKKNTRAIQSYKKAGFDESNIPMCDYLLDEYVADYGSGDYGIDETVVLVKQI